MGRYYTEKTQAALRSTFEEEVLQWPAVVAKRMFGCPCYMRNSRLFAFLSDQGVVLVGLGRADLPDGIPAKPFVAGARRMETWCVVSPRFAFDDAFALVRLAYAANA